MTKYVQKTVCCVTKAWWVSAHQGNSFTTTQAKNVECTVCIRTRYLRGENTFTKVSHNDGLAVESLQDEAMYATCYLVVYTTVQVTKCSHFEVDPVHGFVIDNGPHHDADSFEGAKTSEDDPFVTEVETKKTAKENSKPLAHEKFCVEVTVSTEECGEKHKAEYTGDSDDDVCTIPHQQGDHTDTRAGFYTRHIKVSKVPKSIGALGVHRKGDKDNKTSICTNGAVPVIKEESDEYTCTSEEVKKCDYCKTGCETDSPTTCDEVFGPLPPSFNGTTSKNMSSDHRCETYYKVGHAETLMLSTTNKQSRKILGYRDYHKDNTHLIATDDEEHRTKFTNRLGGASAHVLKLYLHCESFTCVGETGSAYCYESCGVSYGSPCACRPNQDDVYSPACFDQSIDETAGAANSTDLAHQKPGPKHYAESLICFEDLTGLDEDRECVEEGSCIVSEQSYTDHEANEGDGVPHGFKTDPYSEDLSGCIRQRGIAQSDPQTLSNPDSEHADVDGIKKCFTTSYCARPGLTECPTGTSTEYPVGKPFIRSVFAQAKVSFALEKSCDHVYEARVKSEEVGTCAARDDCDEKTGHKTCEVCSTDCAFHTSTSGEKEAEVGNTLACDCLNEIAQTGADEPAVKASEETKICVQGKSYSNQ